MGNAEVAVQGTSNTSSWWRILLLGLGLFALAVVVFALTGNPNLFPTVALIGNFLVPVSYVAFFYERRHMSQVTLVSTARAFFYGGVLGVFAAALLEPVFIRQLTFASAFAVGLIEELWDGLPPLVGIIMGEGMDVFLSQAGVGLVGLAILWYRWREAVHRELNTDGLARR